MVDKKIISVSIDLDSLACYYSIHGLTPPDILKTSHYAKGLARFLELFDELGIRGTLFAVGEDLREPACAGALRDAVRKGHEPANHSWSHPYDLTRMTAGAIRHEILRGHDAVTAACGRAPVGFRAPGYHLSDDVTLLLKERGYRYDASLLPSAPYYLLKSAVILLSRMRGRRSRAIIGGPGMILSPAHPYRSGSRYWRRGGGLLEIPCSVVTPLGIPFIGTSLTLLPDRAGSVLLGLAGKLPFLSLELHAIDMMDARLDGFESLMPYQPDARVSLDEKRRRIGRALRRLTADLGFVSMTLEEAAPLLEGACK
jgi:hypothetical protein